MDPVPSDNNRADLKVHPGKREQILATALRLFTTQGFHATPTAQISREAGVSTGILFHYFPDKNALIDQLYLSVKKDLVESIRSGDDSGLGSRERLDRYFREFICWGIKNPQKITFLEQFCYSPSIGSEVKAEVHHGFAWMEQITRDAISEGILPDLPFEFFAVISTQILFGLIRIITQKETTMTDEEIIRSGLDLMWKS
jgi:AcrR family transcriptional regulator